MRDGTEDTDLFRIVQMVSISMLFRGSIQSKPSDLWFSFCGNSRMHSKDGVELNFVCEECLDVINSVFLVICTLNLIIPENYSRSRNSNSSKIS